MDGGLAVIHGDGLSLRDTKHDILQSMEYMVSTVHCVNKSLRLMVIYRRTPSKKNSASVNLFLDQFGDLIENLVLPYTDVVIVGDFNIHVDNPNDMFANRFLGLLDSYCLTQYVKGATH